SSLAVSGGDSGLHPLQAQARKVTLPGAVVNDEPRGNEAASPRPESSLALRRTDFEPCPVTHAGSLYSALRASPATLGTSRLAETEATMTARKRRIVDPEVLRSRVDGGAEGEKTIR